MKAFSDRPESAKSKMIERMKARSSQQPAAKPAVTPTPEAAKPVTEVTKAPEAAEPKPEVDDDNLLEEDLSANSPVEEPKPETSTTTETPADPKNPKAKINPWKLADEHKAARATLEKENLELKKLIPSVEARKAELAEFESVRARNEELERHMKYLDFRNSKEYKDTYDKPYTEQWKHSMQALHGLTVMDTDGGARNLEPADLLQVVNEPSSILAKRKAVELFGEEYASEVMTERDKIVTLHNNRIKAEEQARAEGTEKFTQRSKQQQEAYEKLNGEVGDTYQRAVLSIKSNPVNKEFFEPIEGDDKANETLTKGYEMVDQAFAKNPMDPALTAEQRRAITKLHAAVRHRAAGFGRVKYLLVKERAQVAELSKKLAVYEGTVPNRGPSPTVPVATTNGGSKMSQMQQRLRARASTPR